MWILCFQLVAICLFLQVPGCFPACIIRGSVASCAFQRLLSIPALPPHITHLYLEMNRIGEVNSSSLLGLQQLQELDLGRQRVPLVVRDHAFGGLSSLRKLTLGFNVGLQLEPRAFVGLSRLETLRLDYCSLNESILTEDFLRPLTSLETLDLFGNQIKSLRPSMFFANMTRLKEVNLKLNKIDQICESDLEGFRGMRFDNFNLVSVQLKAMSGERFQWQECGNPFRGISFQTLDLSHNGFSEDRLKRFFRAIQGTKISHLKLSGHLGKGLSFSNLPDPDRNTFDGLKNSSVLNLDLSRNRIFALLPGVFSPLRGLVNIDVSQNRVNQIHKNAFEGLQERLTSLNLSHNLLGEVYAHTFASLTGLRVLDLSSNHIGVLGYDSFRGLPELRSLFLTGNALQDLGFPAHLPSLDFLLLNDNKLSSSAVSGIARIARNVLHLNIEDNRFTNLEDVHTFATRLRRLRHLFYGGNRIRWCTRHASLGASGLRVVDLHGSSLQTLWSEGKCLDVFDDLGNVLGVDLSSNALQLLPPNIFHGLTSVVEMDLSSNALTYLPPDALPRSLRVLDLSNNFIAAPEPAAFRSLRLLDLRMNRFHCDTNLRSFLSWLQETNVTLVTPARELRCEFPSGLYQVPLLNYTAQATQQERLL